METKICTKCKQELPITDFYKKKRLTIISHYSECKKCWSMRSFQNSQTPERKEYAKNYYKQHKEEIRLKEKNYYHNNKEHVIKIKREWLENNRDKRKETTRKHNKKLRESFLDMYGRVCVCCGEITPEFLTIEHKLGQKGIIRHKKETGKFAYAKAIKEYRPDLYEVLCWNCNCAKGRYGYCPHQKENKNDNS